MANENFQKKIRSMSLFEWICVFGSITDQDANSLTYKKRIPFKLWKRQKELCDFIEKHQIVLVPKSRQKGLSEIAAERALKTLMENPNTEGIAISKSEKFASYFLEKRVLAKYNTLIEKFPDPEMFPRLIKDNKDEVRFDDSRIIRSIASSSTAAASMTADFMIFDEAGGIEEGHGDFKAILTNSLPACDQNPNAWIMIIGTSVPGTYYNELVKKAYDEKNQGEFKYFFIGWHHQPNRDRDWYIKQKDKYGDDVYLQHPTDMDDFFYIKDGLVFKHFDHQEGGRHIRDFDIGKPVIINHNGVKKIVTPTWNMKFITAYDHGTKHPACNIYALYDEYEDFLFIIDETFLPKNHGLTAIEIGERIITKKKTFPKEPNKEIADGAIFNDIGVESVGTQFKKMGLKFKKAKKNDENASRDLLAVRFRDNKILIHSKCYNLIDQLKGYRWDIESKGEKPIQINDDAIDPCRYLCNEVKRKDIVIEEVITDRYSNEYKKSVNKTLIVDTSSVNNWQAY